MGFFGGDLALVPRKLLSSRRFAVQTVLHTGGTLYCSVCAVRAERRTGCGLSEGDCRHLPGTGAAAGDRPALPYAPLFSEPSTGACRRDKDEEHRYLGFISSPKGKEVFRERRSRLLRARIEKKHCRAPALGC